MEQAQATSREAIDTNWDAVTNAYEGKVITETSPVTPKEEIKEEAPPANIKIEEEKAPEVSEQDALIAEAKELGLPETATKEEIDAAKTEKEAADKPLVEFKPEDIDGGVTPEDGTWAAAAIAKGIKVEKDFKDYSFEDFEKDLIAPYVKQVEDSKSISVENLFTSLKPETVAAFKLLEMGVPEDKLFQPTRDIEKYEAMDNTALIRADKELLGWKQEMIDAEIELLTAKGLIDHESNKLRLVLADAKTNIINERQTYIQQYESKKEQAILAQKEQEKVQFKQAMDTVSTFMDVPIPNEVKEAIVRKYNNGAYDEQLNTPRSKVEFVLQKELQKTYLKSIMNTASEKGRDTIRTKLAAVPPVTNNNAGAATKPIANNDPWAAVDKMAKDQGF